MDRFQITEEWIAQAYRFELDMSSNDPALSSHTGAKRFSWNYMLDLINEQLRAREQFRIIAQRQGASYDEAISFAEKACAIPYLVEMNEKHKKDYEAKIAAGKRKPSEYHPVSKWCPWSMESMRYIWNRVKDEVAPWWKENSKECYSSAFEGLARAFKNYFASKDGKRKGAPVGWPKYKKRSGRQSVGFTTGGIDILDRHHVRLPVIGAHRVKESTDKLRLKIMAGDARILRATLVGEGGKTYVSFGTLVRREVKTTNPTNDFPCQVKGHDVGITKLITSSDSSVVENPRAAKQVKKKISRYQRRMDRQHRVASPKCYNPDGTHISGTCHWKDRSIRARENQTRLQKSYARAVRIRKDTIHKASYHAATTNAVNVVEDLKVEQMGRKGHGKRAFNRVQHDATLAEFHRQLAYKHSWYGSQLWLAAWWYGSSKTCSKCKTKKVNLSRSARIFCCDNCGLKIDRDLNAAKNLQALVELACMCILAQISTGTLVDWSEIPVRPFGWELDRNTRSSRGCARAGGRKTKGGERKTARSDLQNEAVTAFDREAAILVGVGG
jgi:putative transposase